MDRGVRVKLLAGTDWFGTADLTWVWRGIDKGWTYVECVFCLTLEQTQKSTMYKSSTPCVFVF